MKFTLKVWRQDSPTSKGRFETYEANNISDEMSFLEVLDVVNEDLIRAGNEPVHFDHDCREGICGSCGMMINYLYKLSEIDENHEAYSDGGKIATSSAMRALARS